MGVSVGRYLFNRIAQAVPVVFGVSLVAFFLIRLTPGDPVRTMLGRGGTPEAIAIWRHFYGLDEPLWVQYLAFLRRIFSLNFGDSIQLKAPVALLVAQRCETTLWLVLYTVLMAITLTIPLAIYCAVNANKLPDHVIRLAMMTTFAMPAFWLGLTLVRILALRFALFPISGLRDGMFPFIWSLTLPALTGALYLAPVLIRTLRSELISSLGTDFVEAARARGLPRRTVLLRYVLRPSLIATVSVLAVNIGYLVGGTVVLENVFAVPGLGTLIVGAVGSRDYPLVETSVLLIGGGFVAINLASDLINAVLDPRIRQ